MRLIHQEMDMIIVHRDIGIIVETKSLFIKKFAQKVYRYSNAKELDRAETSILTSVMT